MTSTSIIERVRIFQYMEDANILSDRELFNEIKLLDRGFFLTYLYLEYKRWHDGIKYAKINGYNKEQLSKLLAFDDEFTIEHDVYSVNAKCINREFLISILGYISWGSYG